MSQNNKIIIIGNPDPVHIGAHFFNAAKKMGVDATLIDMRAAFEGPLFLKKINWRLLGHRLVNLIPFSRSILEACESMRPHCIVSTGIAPILSETLRDIEKLGIVRINYSTDDPFNPTIKSTWFFKALPHYDWVFSTRRSNLTNLIDLGCKKVRYLPFGYAPDIHFPVNPSMEIKTKFDSDVLFVGGGDKDRLPYIKALLSAGFKVRLYGGYWDRFSETRNAYYGFADPQTFRWATSAAKLSLCLVRRANRDGTCMRTFETPAMGACMLTEETPEHRELFGQDGLAVKYFKTPRDLIAVTSELIANPDARFRLARNARKIITNQNNSYADRLRTMLTVSERAIKNS